MFQAVVTTKETRHRKKSKPMYVVDNDKSSRSSSPTHSQATTRPHTIAPTSWKFHGETGTFVATVPMKQNTTGRPNISKPCYYWKDKTSVPSGPLRLLPSLFSDEGDDRLGTGGTESSEMPSPMATEQPLSYSIPTMQNVWINSPLRISSLAMHAGVLLLQCGGIAMFYLH